MTLIRNAILRNCRADWLKVARVISFAHRELKLPNDDASYDLVEQALADLVDSHELEAQGDITDWRHSEVRLRIAS